MSGISRTDRQQALAQLKELEQRDEDYYRGLESYPPPYARVSRQDEGLGFMYDEPSYPTRGSAPARYSPGKDYPFGFREFEKVLRSEEEDRKRKEEEEGEDKTQIPSGMYDPEDPQSTNIFGQPIPRPPMHAGRGYAKVTAPSQYGRDPRYAGGQEYGQAAVSEFLKLVSGAVTGYAPPTGKANIARYPSLFDYV